MTVTEQSGPAAGDAERRAAIARAGRLRAAGREVRITTVWVRTAWWLVQALCAAAGVGASVVSVAHPIIGAAVAGGALLIALTDLPPLALARRLTFARATENVVAAPPDRAGERPVVLVLTASGDLPRRGLRQRLPGGVLRWSIGGLALVTACCGGRIGGVDGTWIGLLQLVPTLALLAALLALLDEAVADVQPGDTAVEAILLAARELDADPPTQIDVAILLAGAGDRQAAGLRAWLAARRARGLTPADAAIVHVERGSGQPLELGWWERGGLLLGGRLHPQLITAARQAAGREPALRAVRAAGRTQGPAAQACSAGWPVIAVKAGDGAETSAFLVALARELDDLVKR